MREPLLEVVVLSPADALAAVAGGADRVELVTDMAADGLTPDPAVFRAVRDAVEVPVRVMVRRTAGFARGASPDALRTDAAELWAAGAREFVGGWLTEDGAVDVEACHAVFGGLPDGAWTFHRAVDHARDRAEAWRLIGGLPGVDTVLTSGAREGVGAGAAVLASQLDATGPERDRSGEHGGSDGHDRSGGLTAAPRVLVGGGLRLDHVPQLRAAGADAFHIGTGARDGGWSGPVDPERVRVWHDAVHRPL
ncbi:copper homeostasis protein CutC [Streptodolium elevatio]|uniref:Copper homeostasis protein cutC homolog n=1 Tax=Streptodolium elevatio TaxID=3157996 RepID=A0ABV3DJT6_9ACTN